MGSDDLFNKRKAKKVNSLERRKASRSSYNRVLIVCEGEKTEPNYFKELVQHYKLHTANVEVDGSCGSSPRSVFNRARELWEKEKRKGDPYDRVYCVFDKDTHETYEEALTNISRKEYKDIFHATTSVPSFEYWLLLHYKFTTKPYAASGKHSVADEVINELREVMPDYSKGRRKVFSELFPHIEYAKKNAERSLMEASKNFTDNPTTLIHQLVDYLQNLKNR